MKDAFAKEQNIHHDALAQRRAQAEEAEEEREDVRVAEKEVARLQQEYNEKAQRFTIEHFRSELCSIARAPYFRCFSVSLQSEILNAASPNSSEYTTKFEDILRRAHAATLEAKERFGRIERNEVLYNATNILPFAKYKKGWVIRADGTLRDPDIAAKYNTDPQTWLEVDAEELMLAWGKGTLAGPHLLAVKKLPQNGITSEQRAKVSTIVAELAQEWDGQKGFSGNTTSAPIGKGWDLSRVTTDTEDLPWYVTMNNSDITPLPRVPTVEELVQERRNARHAQKRAEDDARSAKDAHRRSRESAYTPEVRARLTEHIAETNLLLTIAKTFSPQSEEQRKVCEKIAKLIPITIDLSADVLPADMPDEYEKRSIGLRASLRSLVMQNKISKEIPNFWEKIEAIAKTWHTLPELLNGQEYLPLVLVSTFGGKSISQDEILESIQKKFLEDPWSTSAQNAVDSVLDALIDNAD
jgi:hypothetical protein